MPNKTRQAVFRLTHSARLLRSEHPIDQIWVSHQEETRSEDQISLDAGPVFLLVWRQGFERRIDPVSEQEWLLLNALQRGLNLQSLMYVTGLGEEIGYLLPAMVEKGWVTGLSQTKDRGEERCKHWS
jgi:hypothetical protein